MDFDVFLSHNSKDKPTVRELAEVLKLNDVSVWLDEEQLLPGRPWQSMLENAIRSCRTIAVLVGSEGIGPWENEEMRAFLSMAVSDKRPVIPVLLPKAPSRVDLPIFLQSFTWVDLRDGLTDEGISRLLWGITGRKPGAPKGVVEPVVEIPDYEPEIVRTPLEEVFTTVGLPRFNYVEPTIYSKVAYTFRVRGKHVVLEGPSGTGKTCLVFRILRDNNLKEGNDFIYQSARGKGREKIVVSLVESVMKGTEERIIVIDDFHTLPRELQKDLADQLKVLSDRVFTEAQPTKFVLIGIPTAASALLYNAADLGPRVQTFTLGNPTAKQLEALIEEGEKRLAISFPTKESIIQEANGSFYLCQYICHEICFNAGILETQSEIVPVRYRMDEVRSDLIADLDNRYKSLLVRFCATDLQTYPYVALIGGLARSAKAVIHLNEALVAAEPFIDRIKNVRHDISGALQNTDGGGHLGQFIHYDASIEVFSIEDPSFQYFLKHFNIAEVLSAIACKDESLQKYFVDGKALDVSGDTVRHSEYIEPEKPYRDSVFISYSHLDAEWMEKLTTHLKPLVRKGTISTWTDTQIKPGSRWREEIETALHSASVAVLLVSSDFLASDFINENELPVLLKKAGSKELSIFWLPVRPSSYKLTEINNYQAASDPSRPLTSLGAAEQETILVNVCEKIMESLESSK